MRIITKLFVCLLCASLFSCTQFGESRRKVDPNEIKTTKRASTEEYEEESRRSQREAEATAQQEENSNKNSMLGGKNKKKDPNLVAKRHLSKHEFKNGDIYYGSFSNGSFSKTPLKSSKSR